MSDADNPMLWTYRPPPRQRRPGGVVWPLRKDHVTWSCEMHFRGESYGSEAQILREGALHIGRRFLLREQATRWADQEREWIERGRPDDQ
jgi:hypothetical protein